MNYQFEAANVNFGDPNAYPSNPAGTQALSIPQMPTAQQTVQQSTQKSSNVSFYQKILNFFNVKTGNILTAAIGIAIGFAFKDLISSTVTNVLQPLVIMFLSITHLNNIYDFSLFISPEKNALNVSTFINSLFSFSFVVIAAYYISSML
jgi:large-conductance mechanosensitive channel